VLSLLYESADPRIYLQIGGTADICGRKRDADIGARRRPGNGPVHFRRPRRACCHDDDSPPTEVRPLRSVFHSGFMRRPFPSRF